MARALKHSLFVSLLLGLFLATFEVTFAQSPCGDFVTIEDFEGEVYEERVPIEDCANPFSADDPVPFTPILQVHSHAVVNNDVVAVPEGQSVQISGSIPEDADYFPGRMYLYKKNVEGYLFVFDDTIETTHSLVLEPGEYTAIFLRNPVPTDHTAAPSLLQKVFQWFVPATAYAFYSTLTNEIVTISFTVEYEAVEPLGASSILFLPGIMGSRLYEESDICDNEGIIEQERWFSTDECDQLRLKTDFTGAPLHDLYIKPEEESVIDDIFVISPLYEGFLERLAEEKADEVIADYRAVPYDWRLTLGNILKTKKVDGKVVFDSTSTYKQSYIYQSLQELVETSDSGKVTIVAHSNGGLVAKALILEMQANNDPLLSKIDNLILVAVPQAGTPDAVEGLLQGTNILGGIVIDNVVSRDILNTAPFGHHLLPSAEYFDGAGSSVDTPVLQFLPGSISGTWRDEYGEGITNLDDLNHFLSKDSGRVDPKREDLSKPEVVDNFLLDYATTVHAGQTSFIPPASMEVSQVAGIGVSTPVSLTYFTDQECVSRSVFSFFQCTEYRDKLGYSLRRADEGDGTVVVPSALAMSETSQVDRVWVDLDRYNEDNSARVHRNILEISDIQDFILNTAESTTSRPYIYLGYDEILPEANSRMVFQLHSPLDMWVSTNSGLVSSTTNEVRSSLYRRVGEVQYIEVPATETEVELHLVGKETGSFTLEIELWYGNTLEERIDYVAVPTATGTKVTAEIKNVLSTSVLELDLEGDGTTNASMDTEGELTVEDVVSYQVLVTRIEQLSLKKSLKQVLLSIVKSAEYYSNKKPTFPLYLTLEDALLSASENMIKLYAKKRYISASEAEVLLKLIQILKNKQ